MDYLGYEQIVKADWGFSFINSGISFWFEKAEEKYAELGYHRKRVGLNHIAFRVSSKEQVDKFYNEFLKANKIRVLYESPKKLPQYDEKYYAVYFEDPDRIKLEVAYYP